MTRTKLPCVHQYRAGIESIPSELLPTVTGGNPVTSAHLGCSARAGVHTTEVVEADHHEEVVTIYHIQGEDEWMLSGVEEGNKVGIVGPHHHGDPNNHQDEAQLSVCI